MELFFTILIPIIGAAIIVIIAKNTASHTFKCKNCQGEFKIKWTKVITTVHSGKDYMLVCPHCNTKGMCTEQLKG